MARKKWTPKEEVTEALIRFRDKRKWQQALRRYVLEKQACENYALYFGLDIQSFREWIEIQFTEDLNWDNFATKWQFDHIVPVAYFDFGIEEDLKLCWNFINIRVEKIELNKVRGNRIDVMAVKPYFEALFSKTNYFLCTKMLAKIDEIEVSNIVSEPKIEDFINARKADFEIMYSLKAAEFAQMNRGVPFKDVLLEREILRKFG
jgi:hypothetical protein